MKQILTYAELAAMMKISETELAGLVAKGKFPRPVDIGTGPKFKMEQIEAFLKKEVEEHPALAFWCRAQTQRF